MVPMYTESLTVRELQPQLQKLFWKRRGLKTENGDFDYHAYRESQYDKLAQELRTSLDMEAVYRILEDGLR